MNSNLADGREKVAADTAVTSLGFPILIDSNQLVGEQLAVTRAAEAIVLDPKTWRVAYRGPVAGARGEAWTKDAITAVTTGGRVTMAARAASGKQIAFPSAAARRSTPS